MMNRRILLVAGIAAALVKADTSVGQDATAVSGSAYRIVLRSRHAEVTPAKCRFGQTGGGWIVVDQPESHTVVVTMGGSAVVGSTVHGSNARVNFNLMQDLEIVPVREGLRPPRVGMIGRVVGTLQMSDAGKHGNGCRNCGSAQQGPAVASLLLGETNVLSLEVEPSSVTCTEKLSINHQTGPVEAQAIASALDMETYRLTASFNITAQQGKGVFHRQFAVADFDPAPQLDAFWADALKPFRAVPRENFGYMLVVRVVEDTAAPVSAVSVTATSALASQFEVDSVASSGRRAPLLKQAAN
jgi:hypothetical protein